MTDLLASALTPEQRSALDTLSAETTTYWNRPDSKDQVRREARKHHKKKKKTGTVNNHARLSLAWPGTRRSVDATFCVTSRVITLTWSSARNDSLRRLSGACHLASTMDLSTGLVHNPCLCLTTAPNCLPLFRTDLLQDETTCPVYNLPPFKSKTGDCLFFCWVAIMNVRFISPFYFIL